MIQVYLDTHVVIWLGQKKHHKLSKQARNLIERNDVRIPALVELELQVLHEIGKIKIPPQEIVAELINVFGPYVATVPLYDVCHVAKSLSWTRDMFDRLIVAEAICAGHAPLVTADSHILDHYKKAVW